MRGNRRQGWRLAAVAAGPVAAVVVAAVVVAPGPAQAVSAVRTGMTWTVLGRQGASIHVGYDAQTNAYAGDTTTDQARPILCPLVDGRAKPAGVVTDPYGGWATGAVKVTPTIPGLVLTSQAQGDTICAETFGTGWKLAEFHAGGTGWTFWATGSIPAGTRFRVAISDQPVNPWNSAGAVPTTYAQPKFLPSDAPVPGRFIAMLPESTPQSSVAGIAASLLATYGGTIRDVIDGAGGFSFNATDAQAQAMALDARVETVDQDGYGQPSATPNMPWHLDRVDQYDLPLNNKYIPGATGAGVTIYILDTGFRLTHQEFGGRASQAVDFMHLVGQRDDCSGHGTEIPSPMDRAAKFAIGRGVTVVAAAGNECKDADRSSPARASGVISVGATDRYDTKPSWANYGKVDIFAPGVDMRAASLDGDDLHATDCRAPRSRPRWSPARSRSTCRRIRRPAPTRCATPSTPTPSTPTPPSTRWSTVPLQ